jgi:hypothetical protein
MGPYLIQNTPYGQGHITRTPRHNILIGKSSNRSGVKHLGPQGHRTAATLPERGSKRMARRTIPLKRAGRGIKLQRAAANGARLSAVPNQHRRAGFSRCRSRNSGNHYTRNPTVLRHS